MATNMMILTLGTELSKKWTLYVVEWGTVIMDLPNAIAITYIVYADM